MKVNFDIVENCKIGSFNVYASYFLNGFVIENNTVSALVPFMHGTHGTKGGQMLLTGNTFEEFVDFEDSDFETKIEIRNNHFKKGTNLLAEMQLSPRFTTDSIISNNVGDLKIHTFFGTKI